MNPAEIIHNWFTKLPPEHKNTVAFFVLSMLPGFPITKAVDAENQIEYFTKWLLAESELQHHTIGRVLFIKAVINFTLADRANDESWQEADEMFEQAKLSAIHDDVPKVARTSALEQEKIAFRKRQWKKTLTEWNELCDGGLSNENLQKILMP